MMHLRTELEKLIDRYGHDMCLSRGEVISCIAADLRHLCDEFELNYGHLDATGYSFYCEENGHKQCSDEAPSVSK